MKTQAQGVLQKLLASDQAGDYLAALGALAAMPHESLLPFIRPMLANESARARGLALKIWSRCPQDAMDETVKILDAARRDPSHEVRSGGIRAAALLQAANCPALDWLSSALRDPDYRVRHAARECARSFLPKHREAWVKALTERETDFEFLKVMISELSASDIESRVNILRQLSERHVRHARDKLVIMENISHTAHASRQEFQLLKQVLREEARRHLDVVLDILGCLDLSRQMSYIRAGLASRDKHLWAQALESAMQLKKEGRLFRELAVLFEAERESAPMEGEPPGGRGALAVWLEWCQVHGSEWLAECARYCLENKRFAS